MSRGWFWNRKYANHVSLQSLMRLSPLLDSIPKHRCPEAMIQPTLQTVVGILLYWGFTYLLSFTETSGDIKPLRLDDDEADGDLDVAEAIRNKEDEAKPTDARLLMEQNVLRSKDSDQDQKHNRLEEIDEPEQALEMDFQKVRQHTLRPPQALRHVSSLNALMDPKWQIQKRESNRPIIIILLKLKVVFRELPPQLGKRRRTRYESLASDRGCVRRCEPLLSKNEF